MMTRGVVMLLSMELRRRGDAGGSKSNFLCASRVHGTREPHLQTVNAG